MSDYKDLVEGFFPNCLCYCAIISLLRVGGESLCGNVGGCSLTYFYLPFPLYGGRRSYFMVGAMIWRDSYVQKVPQSLFFFKKTRKF